MADDLRDASVSWIPAANHPTRFRIRFARAELASFLRDYAACGPLFESAYEAAPDAPTKAAMTARSAACYHGALRERSRGEPREAVPLAAPENKLIEWSGRYLCGVAPDATDASDDQRKDLELSRGRAFYRAHDWGHAVAALEHLAFEGGHLQAREAAATYLVALHRMRETSGRAACQEKLAREKARLVALHCSGADEDDADGPSILGLTVSEPRAPSPCEAMRAVGAPPPPLPAPPPRVLPPRLHADRVTVSGGVLPEYVAWVGHLHAGQFQACYDAALAKNPYVEGAQSVDFVIARDGNVATAHSSSHRNADADLDACVSRVALGMQFAQPEGGVVNVEWSLGLSRTRGAHLTRLPSFIQRSDR
jgi:hypothetical protein